MGKKLTCIARARRFADKRAAKWDWRFSMSVPSLKDWMAYAWAVGYRARKREARK